MSLCDSCYSPGACCKRMQFYTSTSDSPMTFWEENPTPGEYMERKDLPFVPLEKGETFTDEETGRRHSKWWFACRNLRDDGRCGDYENRPDVCRTFDPGSTPLCVHFRGAEGTGDGL